jgi:hypothetical protein
MNVAIFWNKAPCGPHMNQRFGGTYHLHLQGRKSTKKANSVKQVSRHNSVYGLHGAISQKIAIFIYSTLWPGIITLVRKSIMKTHETEEQ